MRDYDLHRDIAVRHPLDFTLQYPPRRAYFQENFRAPPCTSALASLDEVLLYVHVPFCQSKCYFCNFAVDVRQGIDIHQAYTDTLCRQLAMLHDALPKSVRVPGIDIGGGTPTLLQADMLAQMMQALAPWKDRLSVENGISIETTPAIAAEYRDRLDALRDGGVDRVSMGIQSANAETLQAVNRRAQTDMNAKAVTNLRKTGFHRLNADLIFGLPDQSLADWRESVERVIGEGFDSITTYDCLYRGKGRAMTKRTADRPTPEKYLALYEMSHRLLQDAGYIADYGSLNYSRHRGETGTSAYFERRLLWHIPYVGVGNYASSQIGNRWWFAPYGVPQWQKEVQGGAVLPSGDYYDLPLAEIMAKQILLSLNYGVIDCDRLRARFGTSFDVAYSDAFAYAVANGWLAKTATGYKVKEGCFDKMPQLRALFYTPRAIDWFAQNCTDAAEAA